MSTYVLGLYEKSMPEELSVPEKLSEAKAAGYDFLELSIDETDRKLARLSWDREERAELVRAMFRENLPIRSICLSGHRRFPLGHPDPAVQERSLEIMAGALSLAEDLGIRTIQLAGYDVYYPLSEEDEKRVREGKSTRDIFGENLKKCVNLAARFGVILAFETMENDFMNTVEKAMYWVKQTDSPYLQVYPDAGNMTNAAKAAGKDVLEDLRTGRGHLAAMHLKETVPGVFREVPYGTGHVDFAAVTKEACALGVRRFLAEFWYDPKTDYRRVLEENNAFLRGFLEEAAR